MGFEEVMDMVQEKLTADPAAALREAEKIDVMRLDRAQTVRLAGLFDAFAPELRSRSARHCMQSLLLAYECGDHEALTRWQQALGQLRGGRRGGDAAESDYLLGCAGLVRPGADNAQLLMTIAILHNDTDGHRHGWYLSAANGRPSILNGTKDLSHWGSNYRAVQSILRPMLGTLYADGGEGATEAAAAELLYLKNDPNGAALYLPAATGARDPEVQFAGLAVQAAICRLDPCGQKPEEVLARIGEVIREKDAPWLEENWKALQVRFAVCAGHLGAVQDWLQAQSGTDFERCCPRNRYLFQTRASALIAVGRYREAAMLTEKVLLSLQPYFAPLDRLECLLDGAVACELMGSRDVARAKLREALEIAEPYGYVRVFADRGRQVLSLLTAYAREETQLGETQTRQLRALTEAAKNFSLLWPALYAPAPETGGEPADVTPTELQLLHLLDDGKNNRQICEELDIKLSTVKFHLHNLFEKLGVTSRTEALSAARRHKIL